MPQYRKLYTKVTQSFDFNEMPDDFTRCLWLLLPLGLDCEGRGIFMPSWIKAKLMPLRDDVENQKIMDAMNWYPQREMIVVYSVGGRDYFYVPTFKQYQSGTEREAKSVLPAPTSILNEEQVTRKEVESKSGLDQELVKPAVYASVFVNESASAIESVYAVYEKEIGQLTPSISDDLADAEKEYPIGYIVDALREAARQNKRSWKYALGILKRWKVEGRGDNHHHTDKEFTVQPGGRVNL